MECSGSPSLVLVTALVSNLAQWPGSRKRRWIGPNGAFEWSFDHVARWDVWGHLRAVWVCVGQDIGGSEQSLFFLHPLP